MNSVFVVTQNADSLFATEYITSIPVNKALVNKIIKSGWDKTYKDSKEWCELMGLPCDNMTAVGHLKMLIKNMKRTNRLKGTLQQQDIGRAYYKNAICLSLLPREVRQALCVNFKKGADAQEYLLFDYDIANAQPSILNNLCLKAKIPKKDFATISQYCAKRDKVLCAAMEQLFKEHNNPRSAAKQLFLVAMNQGSIKYYLENNGLTYEEYSTTSSVKIAEAFQREVKKLFKKHFIPNNKQFYNKVLIKKDNKKGDAFKSFVARILQHLECEVVEAVLTKLMEDKIIKNGRFDYAFDGFLACEDIDPQVITDITKELGWDLIWTKKDPDEGIELWEEVESRVEENKQEIIHPADSIKYFDDEVFRSYAGNYAKLKSYFELFYTFIKNPEPMFTFGRYKSFIDGRTGEQKDAFLMTYHKDKDLRKTYRNIHARIEINQFGQEKKIPFMDDYLDDIDHIKKEEMEFHPQNTNRPKAHRKNYMNSFTGYNDECFEEGVKFDPASLKKGGILYDFMGITKNLVGGKEERKIFLYLLAYKIKYPAVKLPFAILITGKQGTGKNTILERFGDIVGEQHYNTTANLKNITGDYAEGMMNKLIVNLNEINFQDTKGKADVLKSLISENRMSFNVKYCRPIVQNVYALIIATTNNPCSMKLDIVSGERRWFIFRSNDKNRKLKKIVNKKTKTSGWDIVHKRWENKEFIQQLYLYLMTLPIENFNFQQAQYKMASTPAYNQLASYFVPNMALMLKDYIIYGTYLTDPRTAHMAFNIDSDEDEDEFLQNCVVEKKVKKQYYEEDKFYEVLKVKAKDLHHYYLNWYEINGGNEEHRKNPKKFQNAIMALSLKNIKKSTGTGGTQEFTFRPYGVLEELTESKIINLDTTNWKCPSDFNSDESDDDFDCLEGYSSGEDIN